MKRGTIISPELGAYRLQVTSGHSILGRVSGFLVIIMISIMCIVSDVITNNMLVTSWMWMVYIVIVAFHVVNGVHYKWIQEKGGEFELKKYYMGSMIVWGVVVGIVVLEIIIG